MAIKIGDKTLATSVTDETKTALADTTGCTVAEILEQLGRGAHAAQVARALHPFLKDALPLAELAQMILADVSAVREQVMKLLAPAEGASTPVAAKVPA